MYRDVWPLATIDLAPEDTSEGVVMWAKLGLLSLSGVIVPLLSPRKYVPIDPKVGVDGKASCMHTYIMFGLGTYGASSGTNSVYSLWAILCLPRAPHLACLEVTASDLRCAPSIG